LFPNPLLNTVQQPRVRVKMSLVPTAPTRTGGVTREQIADAALAIVERDGAELLTMRKLAAEIGVTSTTIYWHIGGRDDVLVAVLERFSERNRPRRIAGTTSRERVLSIVGQIRAQALQHANISRLAYDIGLTARIQLPWQQALVAELSAAGLAGDDAALAMRGLLYTVGGFIVVALRRAQEGLGSEQAWAGLDDASIDPVVRDRLAHSPDFDAIFERTLTALIDGLLP
jgi:TetR/AcrR family tetracycline transcriptional repressor